MKTILLLLILLAYNTYAQFDSLIFTKEMRLNYEYTDIYPLGDQNGDGYDDIMLYDCNEERGYIYFGGSPMDTVAVNSIRFFDRANNILGSIAVIDINDDGTKDIVVTTTVYNDSIYWHPGPIKIYYGGNVVDTFPNITFYPPPGAKSTLPQVLKDFNGDGKSELVIRDSNLPFSQKQYGTLYFYNTKTQFDTIPQYIITGDSTKKISIGVIETSGDINGDGKTDFTITGSEGEGTSYRYFRSFYLGNENFDLEPSIIYYQDEHLFDLLVWQIINDINGDNKDDILIKDYGYYPYYYKNVILHGSFPIDTIPDVGLNTQNEGLGEIISLGDVNGDGYNDFFSKTNIFGYANIKLWVGGRDMPYTSDDQANKTWFGTSDGFGRILSKVGDVDGDGVNDIAIGKILYGAQPTTFCNKGWIYIFKGDTSVIGDTGSVDVNDKKIIPMDYNLYDPYPNPFNPSTVIGYRLSVLSHIKITVYDLLGDEVAILVNGEKPAGKYEIEFDASKYKLSSGVYFYKLKAEGGEITRKMILLR